MAEQGDDGPRGEDPGAQRAAKDPNKMTHAKSPRRYLKEAAVLTAICVFYFVMGKLGLRMAWLNASATPIWAPTGIALAVFILLGSRVWPAIFAAAFLVNVTTAGSLAACLG